MIDFLKTYWVLIADGILIVCSIILMFLSKKKKISSSIADEAKLYIYKVLPELIKHTEQLGLIGSEKKEVVLRVALKFLSTFLKRDLTTDESCLYRDEISSAIEDILETPQKKGIIYEKKK